jgi:HAD superfamily phosphoserine phosphatase-like hydrolase
MPDAPVPPLPFRKVAAFDVCGTLYRSNTTFDFLDFHFSDRPFRRASLRLLRGARPFVYLNYAWNRLFHRDLIRLYGVRLLRHEPLDRLRASAAAFVREVLSARRIEPVFGLLEHYREEGYAIVLVSASLDFIVEAVAAAVGAQAHFGSTLRTRDRAVSGGLLADLRHAKGDLFPTAFARAEAFVFTTDDLCDLPLARRADACHLVCRKPAHKAAWQRHALPGAHYLELP